MKNVCAVAILFVLWLLSMVFYLPLPLVVVLFGVLVAAAATTVGTAWSKRQAGRAGSVVKPDAKTLNW